MLPCTFHEHCFFSNVALFSCRFLQTEGIRARVVVGWSRWRVGLVTVPMRGLRTAALDEFRSSNRLMQSCRKPRSTYRATFLGRTRLCGLPLVAEALVLNARYRTCAHHWKALICHFDYRRLRYVEASVSRGFIYIP